MCFYHKLRVKTYKYLRMVQFPKTGLIHRIHNYFVQFWSVYSRLAFDTARCRITSRYRTVIEK